MIRVFYKQTNEANSIKLPIPEYKTIGASGMDLRACLVDTADSPETYEVTLKPMERKLIPTGLKIFLYANMEAQVRPRSGLAYKHGITVLNTPGTIDSDYQGEIKVILINLGNEPFTVKHGDRIAQLVFVPIWNNVQLEDIESDNDFLESEELSTLRGSDGFGSTGVK